LRRRREEDSLSATAAEHADTRAHAEDAALATILEVLRERTGADFSRYRRATVRRRVLNRMICLGANTFEHYLDMLLAEEGEALSLLQRITIKVSRFYRNSATFDLLRRDILPELARTNGRRPLRIWCAGCGYGEEAYTLAMLLEEAGIPGTVDASDIDPGALSAGRRGWYPPSAFDELPAALHTTFCEPSERGYRVCERVRARVSFWRHDVISDAPPPGEERFDLVSCRNVLIYLDAEVQHQVLRSIDAALAAGGVLCLGEAEWPSAALGQTLRTMNHKARLFRALPMHSRAAAPPPFAGSA